MRGRWFVRVDEIWTAAWRKASVCLGYAVYTWRQRIERAIDWLRSIRFDLLESSIA